MLILRDPYQNLTNNHLSQQISVQVAGIVISMKSQSSNLLMCLNGAIERFSTRTDTSDVSLRVDWAESQQAANTNRLFESGSLWQVYSDSSGYQFCFATDFFGYTPYKIAHLNYNFTAGEVWLNPRYLSPDKAHYPLEYPLDELLINNLLAQGRGAEVHSCGLVDTSGQGLLFIGQSGAGKTTTARLWQQPGVKILSDDRIILREQDGRIWMHGTPWHGEAELSLAEKAPLDHIFFLSQAPQNQFVPLTVTETVARFFACSFPTFYRPSGIEFTLSFFETVARQTPCHEFRFVPDQSAVDQVRQFVGGSA